MPRRSADPAGADGTKTDGTKTDGTGADGTAAHENRRSATRGESAALPVGPASALGLPGICEEALTPELREAVARLAAERDHLQGELLKAHHRIASLVHLADEDSLTPVANRRAFVR